MAPSPVTSGRSRTAPAPRSRSPSRRPTRELSRAWPRSPEMSATPTLRTTPTPSTRTSRPRSTSRRRWRSSQRSSPAQPSPRCRRPGRRMTRRRGAWAVSRRMGRPTRSSRAATRRSPRPRTRLRAPERTSRGPNVRGNTDYDVTVLKVDLDVPVGPNCLSIDFRFLSDEFPEYVSTSYNDAFIAELDTSDWTTSGSTITAPHNFAFDEAHNEISINAAGAASMSESEAAGTTYDGATPLLSASTPITSGAHSLYLSIFDQGDHISTRRSSSTSSGSERLPGKRASRARPSSRLRRRRIAGRPLPAARTATRSRSRTRAPSRQR